MIIVKQLNKYLKHVTNCSTSLFKLNGEKKFSTTVYEKVYSQKT